MSEKRFFVLLKFLHFADNHAYRGQVSPKFYKVKPVFDHLVGKFSASYVPENQLSIESPVVEGPSWLEGLYPKEDVALWHGILQTL
jgi:hypothetical protein